MTAQKKNLLPLLLIALVSSCVTQSSHDNRPSAKATQFFTDYVNNDGPDAETLPVFLGACKGDQECLDAIFFDYERFGSGDNEAWGDVPDMLLAEMGDEDFAEYASKKNVEGRVAVLKWLGAPGSCIGDEPESRRLYPKTSELQKALFRFYPKTRP